MCFFLLELEERNEDGFTAESLNYTINIVSIITDLKSTFCECKISKKTYLLLLILAQSTFGQTTRLLGIRTF